VKKLEKQKESERLEREKTLESEKLEYERRERIAELERLQRQDKRMEKDKDRDRTAEMERLDREKAAEMEKMRLEKEHELKLRQLETSRIGCDDGEECVEGETGEDGEGPVRVRSPKWEEMLAGRTKRFVDTLWHVCQRCQQMPAKFHSILKISSICLIYTMGLPICGRNY